MKAAGIQRCEICGAAQKGDGWFLLSEDQERNTLQILKWNSRLAQHPGVYPLCSAAHVEELVSHWMVSGSLEYEWSQPGHALVLRLWRATWTPPTSWANSCSTAPASPRWASVPIC